MKIFRDSRSISCATATTLMAVLQLACDSGSAPALSPAAGRGADAEPPLDADDAAAAGASVPADAPRDAAAIVTPGHCPTVTEDPSGKIGHADYLRAHPDTAALIAVRLRPLADALPSCPNDDTFDARCPARDQALVDRQQRNQQQVRCVLDAFGPPGSVADLLPLWYESPRHLTSWQPVPIGLEFQVVALWQQVQTVAAHPFVERIDPAPGQAPLLGVAPAPVPSDCPAATDEPLRKLTRAQIQDRGRQPVAVELRDSALPPEVRCPGDTLCDAGIAAAWDRAILARRQVTCVRRWIDTQVTAAPTRVDYGAATGYITAPALPPFGQLAAATRAFGIGLTWDEVVALARHPDVETVWAGAGLSPSEPPPGCPPELTAPIPTLTCPDDREPATDKISATDQMTFARATAPVRVGVVVRGGAHICPLPLCPGRAQPCSDRDAYIARWEQEARESQRCVRDFIVGIGGSADAEVLWLGNSLGATLTWPQIQQLATHPHVQHIDAADTTAPPP
jgi:hypothetical protein